jgi:hypothetical protein
MPERSEYSHQDFGRAYRGTVSDAAPVGPDGLRGDERYNSSLMAMDFGMENV